MQLSRVSPRSRNFEVAQVLTLPSAQIQSTNERLSMGTGIWVTAENAYNERVSHVENQIIARLRDRLGTARNANEMF